MKNFLTGDHQHKTHWKPFPCSGTVPIQKINLRWPTELALSPLDNSLHILDDHMILKMTGDKRIRVVAGRPTHCSGIIAGMEEAAPNGHLQGGPATGVFLETPQSLAFSPTGELFIAESDSQYTNRIRMISNNRSIMSFAGAESQCSCMEMNCDCFSPSDSLAKEAKLSTISSITVTPSGLVVVSDQGNLRLRAVYNSLPEPNERSEYEVISPTNLETYIFNRFGQHVESRNTRSGKPVYKFSYNVDTSFGKLSTVTDASENKIYLLRDYRGMVKTVESTKGGKCHLAMSRMRRLESITSPDSHKVTFEYLGKSGLLKKKSDSYGFEIEFLYDEFGRVVKSRKR